MIQWELAFFPRVKRPGRDVNHRPPSNAEVKNEWSYTSPPIQAFVAWTGTLPLLLGTGQVTVGSRGHGDVTYTGSEQL